MEESKGAPAASGTSSREPNHLSYMAVGYREIKRGKLGNAIRQLQKSTKIETTDQNRFLLAVAFYLNKEFYEAIGAVRKPLDDPALHVRARYIHAICQGECGLTDEAVEHLDSVTRLEPTFGDAYVSKGALLASDGKMERASEAWAEGKQEAGESARLLACEGFAQLVGGQSQDAVFTLTKAVRMDPADRVAKFFLASALAESGNIQAAKRAYSEFLKLDPKNVQALYLRGRLCARRGDTGGCIADMSTALLHDPRCLAAVVARGIAYTQADNLDAAEKDLLTAQSIADTNEDTVPLFTPHSEVDALSNTVSAATVLPAICRLLANVCLRKKDYDVARDALSVVLRFQPGDVTALLHRSVCNERGGRIRAALKDIAAALKVKPKMKVLKKRRKYLMQVLASV